MTATAAPAAGEVFAEIPMTKVDPDPHNVRGELGDVDGLAKSIKAIGVQQPIIVAVVAKGRTCRYQIIAGHRRFAAAKIAGLKTIPAMLRHGLSEVEQLEEQLTENLQRSDLSVMDEARGFQRLVDLGRSQRAIASKFGCAQAHVSKRLSLLALPDVDQVAIDAGGLTVGEGIDLARLVDHPAAYKAVRAEAGYRDRFRQVLNRELHEIEWAPIRDEAIAKAKADGIEVVKWPTSGWYSARFKAHKGQEDLCDTDLGGGEIIRTYQLADYTIGACDDGHLAVAISSNGTVVTVCTKPAVHDAIARNAQRAGGTSTPRNADIERHQARVAAVKGASKRIKATVTELADPIAGDALHRTLAEDLVAGLPPAVLPVLELLALDVLDRGGLQHTAKRLGIEPIHNTHHDDWRGGVLAWADRGDAEGRVVGLLTVAIAHAGLSVATSVGNEHTKLEGHYATPSINALYDVLTAHGHKPDDNERTVLTGIRGGDQDLAAAS